MVRPKKSSNSGTTTTTTGTTTTTTTPNASTPANNIKLPDSTAVNKTPTKPPQKPQVTPERGVKEKKEKPPVPPRGKGVPVNSSITKQDGKKPPDGRKEVKAEAGSSATSSRLDNVGDNAKKSKDTPAGAIKEEEKKERKPSFKKWRLKKSFDENLISIDPKQGKAKPGKSGSSDASASAVVANDVGAKKEHEPPPKEQPKPQNSFKALFGLGSVKNKRKMFENNGRAS